jgi:hypothetical protein
MNNGRWKKIGIICGTLLSMIAVWKVCVEVIGFVDGRWVHAGDYQQFVKEQTIQMQDLTEEIQAIRIDRRLERARDNRDDTQKQIYMIRDSFGCDEVKMPPDVRSNYRHLQTKLLDQVKIVEKLERQVNGGSNIP